MERSLNCRVFGQQVLIWRNGRENLREVVEGWLLIRLQKGLAIPALGESPIPIARQSV